MAKFDSSVTAYFGGDTSGLKTAVDDAGMLVNKLSDKIGDKVMGMKDLSHAIASALGINIEKIAEGLARMVTGVSKEMEDAYKKSEALQDGIFEKQKKLAEDRLSDEQRYVLHLQERDAMLKKIGEMEITDAKTQLQFDEAKVKLLDKMNEIQTYELDLLKEAKKADEERAKAFGESQVKREQAMDRTFEASLKGLTVDEQIAKLLDNIALKRTVIGKNVLSEKLEEEAKLIVQKDQDKILELQTKKHQEVALSLEDELQLFLLQRKSAAGLGEEESARLQILKLQKAEKGIAVELASLESKIIQGTITPAEGKRVEALVKQNEAVGQQIAMLQKVIENVKDRAKAEKGVSDEIERQHELINLADAAAQRWTSDIVTAQVAMARNQQDLANASDAELRELIRRKQAEIDAIQAQPMNAASVASGNFGAKLAMIRPGADIANAQAELARRGEARFAAGNPILEQQARANFIGDPLQFDEFFQKATQGLTTQQEATSTLKEINAKLRNIFG